ncbi:MAG: cytochrome ubiquinol oxidase subunit I [Bowdeniella nasicola]|nr:cytochrome ubiquinol oxidase subunit I [Bowdeniella nasicola]
MDALDLARWQFGITTVYHFVLVPLTIGLTPLVALMQTMWMKTRKEHWLRLTKFFGKLLLINFALGVATGIVQEFQFGMNWSEYSIMVGDIFGAPLAIEALAAFFLESTFLGLWIFGWNRVSEKIHLASIWCAAIGVNLSAYWILVANSFMQHPVGATFNPEKGRAELNSFIEVITNPTAVSAFGHTVSASFLTAGTFIAGISAWWIVRAVRRGDEAEARTIWRPAAIFGMIVIFISGIVVSLTGHHQGQLMAEQQPMKMASAEVICETENGAGLSILTVGDFTNDCDSLTHILTVPGLASFMATGDFNGEFPGVQDVQSEMQERYADEFGPDQDYRPSLFITYWTFRLMIGLGVFSAALALAALFLLRGGRVTGKKWFATLGLLAIPMPFIAANLGWIFTEMGRQPWVVAPNPASPVDGVYMLTQAGVSPTVTTSHVLISMVLFTLLYAALGVVWYFLMRRYVLEGVQHEAQPDPDADAGTETSMTFVY